MNADEMIDTLRASPITERCETTAQIAELDRRLADHLAHPNEVKTWAEIKAATELKYGRGP